MPRVTRINHKLGYREVVYNAAKGKFFTDAPGDAFQELDIPGVSGDEITQAELDAAIADKVTQAEIDAAVADKVTQTEIDAAVSDKATVDQVEAAEGGYEFTGGFADRTTGTAGVGQIGDNVLYTSDMVTNKRWLRFGFSSTQQDSVDQPYWTDPPPADATGVGLFGGSYMPGGITSMFDFDFNQSGFSDAVETGDLQYTAADGSFDFTQCEPGDLALIRFDFNVTPQIANTTMEVALIWQTRLPDGTPTFTFPLTGNPIFLGAGSVAQTFLSRPLLSAYFASEEDVNARALLAVRADNPIQVQPLTTLVTIQR